MKHEQHLAQNPGLVKDSGSVSPCHLLCYFLFSRCHSSKDTKPLPQRVKALCGIEFPEGPGKARGGGQPLDTASWQLSNRNLFLTALEVRSPRSRFRLIWFLVRAPLLACPWVHSCWSPWPFLSVCAWRGERERETEDGERERGGASSSLSGVSS